MTLHVQQGAKGPVKLEGLPKKTSPGEASPPETAAAGLQGDSLTLGESGAVGSKVLPVGGGVDLAAYFRPLKAGDGLDIDGPGLRNGTGKVTKLNPQILDFSFSLRGYGNGVLQLTQLAGDRYNLKIMGGQNLVDLDVHLDKQGDTLLFKGIDRSQQGIKFEKRDGKLMMTPIELGIGGTFVVEKDD